MSTTEQRSGFRLPWASEPKTHEPPTESPISGGEVAAAIEAAALGWPEIDRVAATATSEPGPSTVESAAGSDEPVRTAAVEAPAAVPHPQSDVAPRRDNPLVTGLVRAMREAANTARVDAAAKASADAEARVEQLRAEAAAATTDLRKQAEEDVSAIRDWSRAQLARIREETERRTADRKARLDRDLEIRSVGLDARIAAVAAVTADFEERMTAFYETLLAEDDPARLAGLAERLPEPPTFEDLDAWVARTEMLDPDDAAAAEAAAMAGLDDLEPVAFDDDGPGVLVADQPIEDASRAATPVSAPSTERRLMVTGLVSVASIAAFKRAVARVAGVAGVSVSSGPDGEFVFSVVHGPETDLAAAVAGLSAFQPVLDLRADGTIIASVTEPEDHA